MLQAWRMVKGKYAATAFDGEGARRHGGRWNSPGVPVVYTSSSKALAALETLVHWQWPVPPGFVLIPVGFAEEWVETFPERQLPAGWRGEPPARVSQRIGDAWTQAGRSVVLALPSVLTGEPNYIINPAHPDFAKLSVGRPEAFVFDPRLWPR